MKTQYKQISISLSVVVLFSVCVGEQPKQPSIPKVTVQEVDKYEKQYLQEYQKIKQNYKDRNFVIFYLNSAKFL